ncbi:hypothetical protein FB45DRAFT_828755 [Roridomyces roridus]|uniref:Oxidoreductase AflY n=1 Tax=Roridomyces roridus TaxID=1738132 RepID=A0AAD7FSZ8_9AGAR|nr:hypothetical protein FB45DRAFT_828755 [Roridomyces roridus]
MTPTTAHGLAPRVAQPFRPGLLSTPTTHEATQVAQELLYEDYLSHHCFFNDMGFHNHLPHHLVAAYDMGAPPALLKSIYEELAPTLRPIGKEGEDITEKNWTSRLGERKAYGSYLEFFTRELATTGVEEVMSKYVMSPEANGNESAMFARLLGGLLHPFLQVGFGVEFGQDFMIAQGLAMGAVTEPSFVGPMLDSPSNLPILSDAPTKGVTLLALLREVYDSDLFKPSLPYEPNAFISHRVRQVAENPDRLPALRKIYAKWSIDTTAPASSPEWDTRIGECFVQSTLLLAATSRPNRAPRMDFFLMHLLTAALCLPSVLRVLPNPVHKAQLLQGYARTSALVVLTRGRPRIDVPLVMSYPVLPKPPRAPVGGPDALGTETPNPWLAMVHNGLHHKDAHVLKTVRSLYYAAQLYGSTPAGEFLGVRDAEGRETHEGAGTLDGSVFVRAAGVMTKALGWVGYGEKEGDWDRSALGWDAAWEEEGFGLSSRM